jgi:hypothetical protein
MPFIENTSSGMVIDTPCMAPVNQPKNPV